MQILVLVAEAAAPWRGSCGRKAIRPQQQPPIDIIHRQRIRAPSAQQAAAQSSRSRRGGGCSLRHAAPVAWERSPSHPRSRPRAAMPSNGASHGARLPRRPAGPDQGEPLLRTTMLGGTKRREQQQAALRGPGGGEEPQSREVPAMQGGDGRSKSTAAIEHEGSTISSSVLLPCAEYDPQALARHFGARPGLVLRRLVQVASAAAAFALKACFMVSSKEKGAELGSGLVALGPTAVKIGQTLSTRPDLLGAELCEELSRLQDNVGAFESALAMEILRQELGAPLGIIFSEISKVPVASASLGQVYRGCLVTGQEVAVKVQRPGALEEVALDLVILRSAVGAARRLVGINQDIRRIVDELGNGLFGELDYRHEAANTEAFATAHSGLGFVATPSIVWELTTRRVLVTSWMDGDAPAALLKEAAAASAAAGSSASAKNINPDGSAAAARVRRMVEMGIECSLVQLVETGVMHADPHPGNLLLSRDGLRLIYLDHGLLSFISPKQTSAMFCALLHLVLEDFDGFVADLEALDLLKPTTIHADLAADLQRGLTSSSRQVGKFAHHESKPQQKQANHGGARLQVSASPGISSSPSISLRLLRAMADRQQAEDVSGPDAVGRGSVLDLGWGQLAAVLASAAVKYRFELPPYLTLVARSLTTLEGLALQVDPGFKVLRAALPSLGGRLLAATPGQERKLLAALLLNDRGCLKAGVLDVLCEEVFLQAAFEAAEQTRVAAADTRTAKVHMDNNVIMPKFSGIPPFQKMTALRRVVLESNLSGLVAQLCSRKAACVRRCAARYLASTWDNTSRLSGSRQSCYSKGRYKGRYFRILLVELWRSGAHRWGFIQAISAVVSVWFTALCFWATAILRGHFPRCFSSPRL